MRRLLGSLLLAVIALSLPSPASAATAPFPYDLALKGAYGTAEVTVPIPNGTTPVRFTGRIKSSFTSPGDFLISVNGLVKDRVPTRGGRFRVPLRPRDVVNGGVTVSLSVRLDPSDDCLIDDPSTAFIRNPRMVLDGPPKKPTTIADFLSPATRVFIVAIPRTPNASEQAAALNAVLAVRHLLGPAPQIRVRAAAAPPRTTPDRHVIVVDEDATGSSALSMRSGRLFVTGSDGTVEKAAISIGDPDTALLNATTVRNLSGFADYSPVPSTTTIADLGIPEISLSGIGTVTTTAQIPQAAFGEPVSQLIVNMRGTVTPVRKGQQGRVNIRWNDKLVASQALSNSSRLSLDFTIGAGDLFAVNYLTTEMEYLPGGANCQQPLPGELQVDTTGSEVTATTGDSAPPGFQRFPQSFPAVIPVSFGTSSGSAVADAARLLDAAASVSPLQYSVTVEELPTRAPGALITGVSPAQAEDLGAPLPDQDNLSNFPPGRGTPYAALQAYYSNGDDLMVLFAEPRAAARKLATWPSRQTGGWSEVEGQVYVMADGLAEPQEFVVRSTAPDRQRPQLIAAALLTVALLIGLLVWLRWRFRRR